jgi:hypothetical protein
MSVRGREELVVVISNEIQVCWDRVGAGQQPRALKPLRFTMGLTLGGDPTGLARDLHEPEGPAPEPVRAAPHPSEPHALTRTCHGRRHSLMLSARTQRRCGHRHRCFAPPWVLESQHAFACGT